MVGIIEEALALWSSVDKLEVDVVNAVEIHVATRGQRAEQIDGCRTLVQCADHTLRVGSSMSARVWLDDGGGLVFRNV